MNGNPKVVATLQDAVALEARLNLQYRLDARTVRFMGAKKVAKKLNKFGDDAHFFLKKVTDRVLFLSGDPSYGIDRMSEAKTLTETLQNELALEMSIIAPYEEAVRTATEELDDTTRNLFEHLLKWHEKHVGWLEQQLVLIKGLGEVEYIAEKL